MRKKLTNIGKSKGLILDKTLLGLLGIGEGEDVSLKVEGHRLIVEPVYANPIEEIRFRLKEGQNDETVDRLVDSTTRAVRNETVRKLKTRRAR